MQRSLLKKSLFLLSVGWFAFAVAANKKIRIMQKKNSPSTNLITRAKIPSSAPCYTISGKLKNLSSTIDTCCTDLSTELDDTIAKVDGLLPCEQSILFDQSDIPLTISASGTYCLSENVSTVTPNRAITIDADDVTINLNNFSVSGGTNVIETTTGHRNITIRNGLIQNATPTVTTNGYGLFVNNATSVVVQDVTFANNLVGALFSDSRLINMSTCNFTQNIGAGLVFNESINAKISDVLVHDNAFTSNFELPGGGPIASNACLIESSTSFTLVNSIFSNNNRTGGAWNVVYVDNSRMCNFDSCYANSNLGTADGFVFDSSSDCICLNCSGNNNRSGFVVNGSSAITLNNCTGQNNTNDGIFFNGGINCCVQECTAKNNTQRGFALSANSDNNFIRNCAALSNNVGFFKSGDSATIFFGNYAQNNTTFNYNGSTNFIPTFTYDISAGTYTPQPNRTGDVTAWDNINAMP